MRIFILFLFIGIYCAPCMLYAQEYERKKDSTDIETKKKYEDIKEKSKDGKVTRFLSRVLTRDPNKKGVSNTEDEESRFLEENQGKVIRNIKITTLDPFGYSVTDTTRKPKRWIEKAGNAPRIKSSRLAIRNFLLFKKNQTLDSVKVMESERILRDQSFVRRVRIEVDTVSSTADSIDLKVRVLDSWSTFIIPSMSSDGYKGQLKERNFIGLGHTFVNKVLYRTEDGKTTYSGNYIVPNIYNTHISSNIRYSKDLYDNYYKKLAFDRPFYSTLATWAGGAELSELYYRDSLPDAQQEYERQPVKYFQQRYWAGHSLPVLKNSTHRQADYRLISSIAYETKSFSEVPTVAYDSVGYYSDDQHLLIKLALSSNRYVQDRYVFRHNEIEDVPVGQLYALTGGVRRKHHENQMYLGLRYSFGNYHRFGYLSGDINFGSYFDHGKLNQAALNFNITYFTPIFDVGSWRIRQFVSNTIVFGVHRDAFVIDRLNLLGETGIEGYNESVYGNKKAILTLQTQTYAPWAWLGFRFNPYLTTTFGVVAEEDKTIFDSPLHSKIGLGVLITNDYFVIDRIQFSISYYPHIPADGSHIFNFNSLRNDDIYLRNFTSGRPEIVPYTHPREDEYP